MLSAMGSPFGHRFWCDVIVSPPSVDAPPALLNIKAATESEDNLLLDIPSSVHTPITTTTEVPLPATTTTTTTTTPTAITTTATPNLDDDDDDDDYDFDFDPSLIKKFMDDEQREDALNEEVVEDKQKEEDDDDNDDDSHGSDDFDMIQIQDASDDSQPLISNVSDLQSPSNVLDTPTNTPAVDTTTTMTTPTTTTAPLAEPASHDGETAAPSPTVTVTVTSTLPSLETISPPLAPLTSLFRVDRPSLITTTTTTPYPSATVTATLPHTVAARVAAEPVDDCMMTLMDMGFCNRERNKQLIAQYKGDMQQIVSALVAEVDSNWDQRRHY